MEIQTTNTDTYTATIDDQNLPIEGAQTDLTSETPPTIEGTEQAPQLDSNKQQDSQPTIDMNPVNEETKQDLVNKGIDFSVLEKEFADNGSLSDESMQALESAGYPKELVNAFIKQQEAQIEQFVSTVKGYVGSEEEYQVFTQFISSLGEQAVQTYETAIKSGHLGIIQATINNFKSQMQSTYGTSNTTIMGTSNTATVERFNSAYEMVQAINDERYYNDSHYREQVAKKIENSNF